MNKKDLWVRISTYEFGDIVPKPVLKRLHELFKGTSPSFDAFADKLSKKCGWSMKFTLLAIEEYRKFLYLASMSESEVTPSTIIDKVWHQHVLFTQGYRKFCENVLGYTLDHNPSLIEDNDEIGIFNSQYEATLVLYKKEFNKTPPKEIWGQSKIKKEVPKEHYEPYKKKRQSEESGKSSIDEPLYSFYPTDVPSSYHAPTPESGHFKAGGGEYGGGGAGSSWQETVPTSDSHHSHDSSTFDSPVSHDSSPASSCTTSSCSTSSSCGGSGGD